MNITEELKKNITEDIKKLREIVLNLANDTFENGGASYNLRGETPHNLGYMIALDGYERRVPVEEITADTILNYILDNQTTLLSGTALFVGTWLDEETNDVCLDLSQWQQWEDDAIRLGKKHGQKAIYNLATGESITL